MKEYKDISTEFAGGFIKMNFLNGQVMLPDRYGGFVISPGCGSGKTTVIRDIIRKKFNKGILYSASTIEECNLMYQFCKELVDEINDPSKLTLDDIVVLHSGAGEGVDNKEWRKNPSSLMSKKILICTHHKLMYEFIIYLLRTTFNKQIIHNDVTSVFRLAGMGIPMEGVTLDLPREYVLIDELPTLSPIKFTITQDSMKLLAHKSVETELYQMGTQLMRRTKNISYEEPIDLLEMKEYYDSLPKGSMRTDINGSDMSRSEVDKVVLSILKDNFNEYINMGPNESRTLRYSITDFITDDMKFKMLVFDGTGDITFSKDPVVESTEFKLGTHKFTLVNLGSQFSKYNSEVNVKIIPNFDFKRKLQASEVTEKVTETIDKLLEIINKNNRTLIVTWMNLRSKDKSKDTLLDESVNESIKLSDLYQKELERRGIPLDKFAFIHYQSGLDKATNKFMDYDSIVFLGEFHVPNYVVDEFNDTFRCRCTVLRYRLYQVIQAICRTRIRLHKGLPINVYFTDDWSEEMIGAVKYYLTSNSSKVTEDIDNLSESKLLTMSIKDSILNQKIKPKWRSDISSLMDKFPEIEEHILNIDRVRSRTKTGSGDEVNNQKNITIEIVISLDQLNDLCPRKEVKVRSYDQLSRYLRTHNIVLTIVSQKTNRDVMI